VRRFLERARPALTLELRPLSQDKVILHLARLEADAAVLLTFLFTGKAPSRHGFLTDEATEDLSLGPPALYPDEGVGEGEVRPDALGLAAKVRAPGTLLPIRGFLPIDVPTPEGPRLFRALQRGVVLELEVQDGAGFRNVLTREEGERLAGHLIRLKAEGKVELELRSS
jgi:hypothetical protein